MKESGRMIREMGLAFSIDTMVMYMRDNGRME